MIRTLEEIADLAEFVGEENFMRGSVSLNKIANKEGILVCDGNYGSCFTGMLRYVQGEFQIFLNMDKLQSPKYARSRFTQAHELGHYFIDPHRNTLKAGYSLSYDKNLTYFSNHQVEKEANHFATHLLMPRGRFSADAAKLDIGAQAIRDLAKKYKTSLTCTAIHYQNIIDYPCGLLFWKPNQSFARKNYSKSLHNMVKRYSPNFCIQDGVREEIFEGFSHPYYTRPIASMNANLSSFYPDIIQNGPGDLPLTIDTLNLQSHGFLSLIYVN